MNKTLLILAVLVAFALPVSAQTALNQVYLAGAVTSDGQSSVQLSVADSVSAGHVIYVDGEAMTAISCSSTTDICTVRRGQLGTRAEPHINRSIVYTGAANRFYLYDPAIGSRCVRGTSAQYEPWINVVSGHLFACTQTYGTGSTGFGQWVGFSLSNGSQPPAYRAIFYPTSRTADATVITPALTVNFWDRLVASLTYSGTFEVFLPNPTGLPLGHTVTVSDFAKLNSNAATSTVGRTTTIRGLFENGDNTVTLANWQQFEQQPGATTERLQGVGASTSFYVGITASSMFYWMSGSW